MKQNKEVIVGVLFQSVVGKTNLFDRVDGPKENYTDIQEIFQGRRNGK